MQQIFRWKCPYCGHENKAVHRGDNWHDTRIVTCDNEEGGCDQQVVLRSHIEIAWETLKFESAPATSGQGHS